jgi:hypothetical protein
MRRKILLSVCSIIFAVFSMNVFAVSVFPNAFQPQIQAGKNCAVASDIIPAFCAPSGAGSFSAAVRSCAPSGMTMHNIYTGMLAVYGSLQNACAKTAKKYGGTVQACIGQWTCYWNGGESQDMSGLCDGNGQACASL